MRTGELCRDRVRGFTYLWLLFALALGGVALAAIGERWQLALQRERETELLFRGGEIRTALERFAAASAPAGAARLPKALEELVQDERQSTPRHWLRRVYPDPFTGRADWQLLRDAQGHVIGVASAASQPALRRIGLPAEAAAAASAPLGVSDWRFVMGHDDTAGGNKPKNNTTNDRSPP